MTPIAVCADDYAQNAAISAGILELLDKKGLSATSCFSTAPTWREQAAPALKERASPSRSADVGLHFNLTEGFGAQPTRSLNSLILRSLAGELKRKAMQIRITTTLQRQLDAFEAGLGIAPDFVDGHQHVHQFRGVRDVLLQVLEQRYPGSKPWIRSTVPASRHWRGKPKILELLGGKALTVELSRRGLPGNHGFAGVYGFDRPDYAACFAEWLQAAQPGMLIMCHPAKDQLGDHDSIAAQRVVEYRYFTSPAYPDALRAAGVQVQRLSTLLQ